MGTLRYCDMEDCQNTDHNYDKNIYWLMKDVEEAVYKANLVSSCCDIHICEDCLNNYINEEEELLKVDEEDDDFLVLGKDFKV